MIFAFFPDNPEADDSSLASQYYKRQEVTVQGLWGNQGSLVLGLNRIFSRPSTYSVMIIAISALVGLACFYMASHSRENLGEGNKGADL